MTMKITLEEVIRRHKESNPNTECIYNKTVLGKTLYDKVIITCKKHGDFLQAPLDHMKGRGCPICGREKMKNTKTTNINILIQKSKDKFEGKFSYDETIKTYKNMKTKCKFHCNECNIDFEATFISHLNSNYGNCPYCRIKRNKTINYEMFLRHTKEYGITEKCDLSYITEYIDSRTKVPVYCHKKDEYDNEHGIFMIKPNDLLQGKGCPKCAKRHTYTGEELLLKFKNMNGDNYIYENIDGKKMRDKIDIYCNKCHKWFKQELHGHLKGQGCPFCNTNSRFERILDINLKDNNIEYERQKRFKWLSLQSIDFYVDKIKVGIECQGSQHFEPSIKFGGEKEFQFTLERDKRKKRLCKENGVELVYFLDKKYNSYMEEDDIYFNKKEDLLKYIQLKLDNITEK